MQLAANGALASDGRPSAQAIRDMPVANALPHYLPLRKRPMSNTSSQNAHARADASLRQRLGDNSTV